MAAYLGEFEQLVLLAILRLGPKATCAAIQTTAEEGDRRRVWIGAVYTTPSRLEPKGLIRSRIVTPALADERRRAGADGARRSLARHERRRWGDTPEKEFRDR
jgi:hypothetical protein